VTSKDQMLGMIIVWVGWNPEISTALFENTTPSSQVQLLLAAHTILQARYHIYVLVVLAM